MFSIQGDNEAYPGYEDTKMNMNPKIINDSHSHLIVAQMPLSCQGADTCITHL